MNTVLKEGATWVEGGWVMGVMTALFLVFFIGWTAWAYSKDNREKLEEAGRLPLTTGD